MQITKVYHYQVELPLKATFITSYNQLKTKTFDLYFLEDEQGNLGIGELVAFELPDYVEETLPTARLIIQDHLIPILFKYKIEHPSEINRLFSWVKGNQMAKACLEMAMWDLYSKRRKQSLNQLFPTSRAKISVGVSIGMEYDLVKLLEKVRKYVDQGYTRVKLKIKPGYDFKPLAKIRQQFPNLLLMADANSAYTVKETDALLRLDSLNLAMIEQPFASDDYVDHGRLGQMIQTPICLDENIRSVNDCRVAKKLDSCHWINLKLPRVGGIYSGLEILNYCKKHQLKVWLGGMFESGIGRAYNLHFASQLDFQFPGDISASNRYFEQDIIKKPFTLTNGEIEVPKGLGIGVEIDWQNLAKFTKEKEEIFK